MGVTSGFQGSNVTELIRLAGIRVTQSDLPHWLSAALRWVNLVKAMQGGYGSAARDAGDKLESLLKGEKVLIKGRLRTGPASVYALWEEYCAFAEAERARQNAGG